MSAFETVMPFLVLALALGTGVVFYLIMRVEANLAARKEINLLNYRQKNHLFYITRDIPTAVFAGAMAAGSLVMGAVALFNPVIRIYVIPLLALVAVNAVAIYFALSRTKFTRDIRVFDAYYVQVADLLANKDRTQRDIGICQNRVTELRQKLNRTIKWFNQDAAVPVDEAFLPSLFAPVNTLLQDYTREIDRFSGAIEADFNKAIREFLLEKIEPQLHVVPLRAFDEVAADDLISEIKSSFGEKVAQMAIEQVASGAVKSARALANILSLLNELGVKVDGETMGRCLRAANGFEDRAQLAETLYKNKQIPAALVREILIPENMEWCFAQGMAEAFNHRELISILADLLAADRTQMCYLLLSQFDVSYVPVLREVMHLEEARAGNAAPNNAARQAAAYLLILGNEYAVGNAASVFENLAMMLFERRAEIGFSEEEQARIVEIVRTEQFMQSRREIGTLYTKATELGKPLLESATRIFLQYVMDPPAEESFLDPTRLAALLGEYRFTLSLADLTTLRALVAGLLLCTSGDARVLQLVLQEMKALPTIPALPEDPTVQTAKEYGRAILTYLAQKDRVRLRSAIYRTESQRLALDRVLALCKKEG